MEEMRTTRSFDQNCVATVDAVSRFIKLSIYLASVGKDANFHFPTLVDPCEEAILVMMVRDEGDIMGQNLLHHYQIGFRKYVILLNCCADRTQNIIGEFQTQHPDAIVCTIVDPIEGYWQSDKTGAAVEFARLYFKAILRPATWCFILDADEFICERSSGSTSAYSSWKGRGRRKGLHCIASMQRNGRDNVGI